MLTHPPPCPTDPAGQPSRAEPSQGPLPQPLKAWPLGSSQGTVGASGLPWKAAHRLQGAGHVPDAHSLGCGLSPPFLQSERAPAPCACVAPSSAPAWLVHSPLMDLHQESRQGGARRSHVCTSPLPGGRQGTSCLHPACRALQREASPAPGARSPERDSWGHVWGLLGTEHSGACVFTRSARRGGSQAGTSVSCRS